jgi:hypothetical protein
MVRDCLENEATGPRGGCPMQSIEFTVEEIEVMREFLRTKVEEIDVETFRTDAHDFKQMLKHRRDLLEHVLTKFSSIPVPA